MADVIPLPLHCSLHFILPAGCVGREVSPLRLQKRNRAAKRDKAHVSRLRDGILEWKFHSAGLITTLSLCNRANGLRGDSENLKELL